MSATTADSPIDLSMMQLFQEGTQTDKGGVTYSDGSGIWNLGRHTASAVDVDGLPGDGIDGGVVCVSCHAIHGVQDDDDPSTDIIQVELGIPVGQAYDYNPAQNLLAIPQSAGSSFGSMTQANGAGIGNLDLDGGNRLCEACHVGPGLTMNDGNPYATWGAPWKPNPGASAYSHPIDDAFVLDDTLVTDFSQQATWPNKVDGSLGDTPICESCHIPHPARAVIQVRGDVNVLENPGAYILRAGAFDICGICHLVAPLNHHPVSDVAANQFMAQMQGVVVDTTGHWPATGVKRADNQIGDDNVDGMLTCGDCHNGVGAHNWDGENQVGLDPDWWPIDNGRTEADTAATELLQSTGQSSTCELCHYMLQTGSYVPGNTPTQADTEDWDEADRATGFEKIGTGTHFLGAVNLVALDWAEGSHDGVESSFNATTDSWPDSNGWSRWGTTTAGDHLVCESCHDLEPDKNVDGSKLLLHFYAEETPGAGNENQATSEFCEGCHSVDGPDGTHAMTANTVSRTNMPLEIANHDGFTLLSSLAPNGAPDGGLAGSSSFPLGGDFMSCDSCHQVHDANTQSATYILDAPEVNVGEGPTVALQTRGGTDPLGGGLAHPLANTQDADGLPDLDFTGFCDQCHWYTWDVQP
jgi:hypothetical protein